MTYAAVAAALAVVGLTGGTTWRATRLPPTERPTGPGGYVELWLRTFVQAVVIVFVLPWQLVADGVRGARRVFGPFRRGLGVAGRAVVAALLSVARPVGQALRLVLLRAPAGLARHLVRAVLGLVALLHSPWEWLRDEVLFAASLALWKFLIKRYALVRYLVSRLVDLLLRWVLAPPVRWLRAGGRAVAATIRYLVGGVAAALTTLGSAIIAGFRAGGRLVAWVTAPVRHALATVLAAVVAGIATLAGAIGAGLAATWARLAAVAASVGRVLLVPLRQIAAGCARALAALARLPGLLAAAFLRPVRWLLRTVRQALELPVRVLRWLWRTLVVRPLRAVGRLVRDAFRALVRPFRNAVRGLLRPVRDAARGVRSTVRNARLAARDTIRAALPRRSTGRR